MNCCKSVLSHHATALKIDNTGTCKELSELINKKLGYGYYKILKNGNISKNSKNIVYFTNKHKLSGSVNKVCPDCGVRYPESKFKTLSGAHKSNCAYCRRKKEKE